MSMEPTEKQAAGPDAQLNEWGQPIRPFIVELEEILARLDAQREAESHDGAD